MKLKLLVGQSFIYLQLTARKTEHIPAFVLGAVKQPQHMSEFLSWDHMTQRSTFLANSDFRPAWSPSHIHRHQCSWLCNFPWSVEQPVQSYSMLISWGGWGGQDDFKLWIEMREVKIISRLRLASESLWVGCKKLTWKTKIRLRVCSY